MSSPAGDGNLSPRLAALAEPALRSVPPAIQAEQLSLAASGPGSLVREGSRVLAEVRFEGNAAAGIEDLRAAGAEIVDVSSRYRTVTVAAEPGQLPAVAEVAGVEHVGEVLAPVVRGADCGGAVRSEGDAQLNAASARAGFAVDGSGVTVGILSDSFDRYAGAATHAAGDVASGDLPGPGSPCGSSTPVSVLDDSVAAGEDEGRAMAQVVHDLAPGASIDFATAFTGETAFAEHIRALAKAGAKVIVDDVGYFREPFFQDGPIAAAISEVTEKNGVSYFSAAGNDNLFDGQGREIASWEAPEFRDSGSCPPELEAVPELEPKHCMDFDPGAGSDNAFGITVEDGATLTVDLQWAEPWGGVRADVDAYLLDAAGKPLKVKEGPTESLVGSYEDNVGAEGSQRPVEVFQWKNTSGASREVELAVNDCFGACNPGATSGLKPRLKFSLLENGHGVSATEYPRSAGGDTVGPTVYGHAGASDAIAVGAVRYNNGARPESFSSRGPVTHYFGPVTGPLAAKAIPPQTISKPDVVATDGGADTFFGSLQAGVWRFYGTSASAPHAAALAALVRQANPAASAAQIRADLSATAHPLAGYGPNAVGAGIVDAFGAVAALAPPPTVTISEAPATLSRNRRPTIKFSANRPAVFSCQIDGGTPQACASPFTVPLNLADGQHAIAVSGTDLAGRVGSAVTSTFTIDTRPPRTSFAGHPRRFIRTHRRRVRESFRFHASEPNVVFACKVDRGLLRFCGSHISRRFGPGRHAVQVRARDAAGNVDPTPAVFHFRVKRVG